MSEVLHVNSQEFENVIAQNDVVFVDFLQTGVDHAKCLHQVLINWLKNIQKQRL